MSFHRALKIVFDRTPEDTIDLFQVFPSLRRFFERRRLHAVIRTFGDLVFTFIILAGLFGPQDPARNCTLYLSWGLWWPTIVLSWFFVGRMWCGFCPFPGIGRIVQKLGLCLHKPIPGFIKRNGPYISVFLLAIIIWLEESTGIKESPRGTALLILSIMAGATLMAVFYPKQAWCRYLCPMGRLLGVGATLSIMEFRPNLEKCRTCKTFACKRGVEGKGGCPVYLGAFNVKNNLDCLICGHCLSLCDKGSPMLNLRSPFKELLLNKGRFVTCSFIIPFLMGSQLVRFLESSNYSLVLKQGLSSLNTMVTYSGLLVIAFFYILTIIKVGAKFFGQTEDELFGKFSPMVPILIPMAFSGELAYRLDYAISGAPEFFPVLGRQFGLDSLLHWTFGLPSWILEVMNISLIASAVAACCYLLYRFVNDEFEEGLIPWWRSLLVACLILITGASYIFFMANM